MEIAFNIKQSFEAEENASQRKIIFQVSTLTFNQILRIISKIIIHYQGLHINLRIYDK